MGESEAVEAPQLTGGAAVLARMRAQRAAAAAPPAAAAPEAPADDGPQLTGSAALLARMRKSRAVTGEPAAAPAATPPAAAAATGSGATSAVSGAFDGTLHILYGGEAATQVAVELADAARAAGLSPQLVAASDFRGVKLESERRVAIFVVETVENAQPAEAAGALVRHFNRRRKEAAPGAAPLAGLLTCAVLGLGDTNLLLDRQTTTGKDCNQAAAALDAALRQLGATPLCARCEANDAVGLQADVEPWAAALWPKLQALRDAAAAHAAPAAQAAAALAPPSGLLVLYGSQTGNSAEIARNIGAAATAKRIATRVASMDEVSPDEALRPGAVLLFVVSSTGDGDPPDNCASFYAKLRKLKASPSAARGVAYAVLGLGDQNYTKFMAVPRFFSARLEALGGVAFAPRGEADETEGLFEAVDAWTDAFWPRLDAALAAAPAAKAAAEAAAAAEGAAAAPAEAKAAEVAVLTPPAAADLPAAAVAPAPLSEAEAALVGVPPLAPCRVALRWLSAAEAAAALAAGDPLDGTHPPGDGGADGRYAPDAPLYAPVAAATPLTAAGSDRRVVHLEFDTAGSKLAFEPGDSLGVLPENEPGIVAGLLARLALDGDAALALEPSGLLRHVRCPVRCGDALRRCVEVAAPPRRSLLRALAEHAADPAERLELLRLSSRGGRERYEEVVAAPRLTLLELLHAFPSVAPPLALLLDALPPLAPRLYSLAAAPEAAPARPAVAFSRVALPRGRAGVATGYLDSLQPGARVPIFARSGGAFAPPADPATPLVLVGPGTGVAPFRGFLQRRAALRAAATSASAPPALGEAWLFFGCRNEAEDYLYRTDLEGWAADGTLSRLITAFSRPPDAAPGAEKVYVQHRLREHGAALAALIAPPAAAAAPPAAVYVCGDGAGMAKGVHAALLAILEEHAGLSAPAAVDMLADMARSGRYVRDIWSA